MISLFCATLLAFLAIGLRADSVSRKGVLSEELVYFLLCMGAAYFWMHQELAYAYINFAEDSQARGVEREADGYIRFARMYADIARDFILPSVLAFIALGELAARFAARATRQPPATGNASSTVISWRMSARRLGLYLLILIAPALMLYLFLVFLLDTKTMMNGVHHAYRGHTVVHIGHLLVPLLSAYCVPASLLHPYWAPGMHPSQTWWDGAIYWGGDPLGNRIFPKDLMQFLFAALPWAVLAVMLAWQHDRTRELFQRHRKSSPRH